MDIKEEECIGYTNAYRVAICHNKDCGNFLVIYGSQVGSIIRVGHVCDCPFSLHGFTFILQGVALNRIKTNDPIL